MVAWGVVQVRYWTIRSLLMDICALGTRVPRRYAHWLGQCGPHVHVALRRSNGGHELPDQRHWPSLESGLVPTLQWQLLRLSQAVATIIFQTRPIYSIDSGRLFTVLVRFYHAGALSK